MDFCMYDGKNFSNKLQGAKENLLFVKYYYNLSGESKCEYHAKFQKVLKRFLKSSIHNPYQKYHNRIIIHNY